MSWLKNIISLFILLLVLSCGLIIGVDNNSAQALTLLDWTTAELPLYQWLFIFLAIGFLIGILFMFKTTLALQYKVSRLNKTLKKTSANQEKLIIGNVPSEVK